MGLHVTETVVREVAVPRSFAARYGEGVDRGLCLGGGGLFLIAWTASYLHTLAEDGVALSAADRVVGTSAGAVAGAALISGHARRLNRTMSLLTKLPDSITAKAMAVTPKPSQNRALELMMGATDAEPETIRSIGHAALAAVTKPNSMQHVTGFMIGAHKWPSAALEITSVDAFTAERCILTSTSGVSLSAAIAASCAVPGFGAPQLIGDRLCMDGGMAGTGVHLDRVAGARRVLVLSLNGAEGMSDGMATQALGSAQQELDDLAASGTEVLQRSPEAVAFEQLMTLTSVPDALAMGKRQAKQDHDLVASFWR